MKRVFAAKSRGNIADLMSLGVFLLAMMTILIAFFNCVRLMQIKEDVSQIVRKYTLVAETEGYITDSARQSLISELKSAGVTDVDLGGTTFSRAGYGSIIYVRVAGKIDGKYVFSESRASTAKY